MGSTYGSDSVCSVGGICSAGSTSGIGNMGCASGAHSTCIFGRMGSVHGEVSVDHAGSVG